MGLERLGDVHHTPSDSDERWRPSAEDEIADGLHETIDTWELTKGDMVRLTELVDQIGALREAGHGDAAVTVLNAALSHAAALAGRLAEPAKEESRPKGATEGIEEMDTSLRLLEELGQIPVSHSSQGGIAVRVSPANNRGKH